MRRWIPAITAALALTFLVAERSRADEAGRFFPATGHAINTTYGFQQFWDDHDGATMLGAPLTDIVIEANLPAQYFERGRLERRGDAVVPGALGRERTRWRTLPPGAAPDPLFAPFWQSHAGELWLGQPLGAALWEPLDGGSVRVQYFERGRLEAYPEFGGTTVAVGLLGRDAARARGLINDGPPSAALTTLKPEQQAAFAAMLPTPTAAATAAPSSPAISPRRPPRRSALAKSSM